MACKVVDELYLFKLEQSGSRNDGSNASQSNSRGVTVLVRGSSRGLDGDTDWDRGRAGSGGASNGCVAFRHEAHGPEVVVGEHSGVKSDTCRQTAEDERASHSAEGSDVTAGTEMRVDGCADRAPLSPFSTV